MIADALLWLKSTETSFSSVTFRIFLSFVLEAENKELFNFFMVIFFFTLNINSINETFGVGTLIATPSSLPFNEGIISPIAFDAPVDVGTIDWLADLALLGSLWELSNILWSLVKACMVVIKPLRIIKFLLITSATGAKQFVVQEAAEIILSFLLIFLWFTPKTIVLSAILHGADTITFFTPFSICGSNWSLELNLPVHSKT